MNEFILILAFAVLIDLVIGDPVRITHPVVVIGKLISRLEKMTFSSNGDQRALLIRGGTLVVVVLLVTYLVTSIIISVSFMIHYWLGMIVSILLFSTTLAAKGLKNAGLAIYNPLVKDNLAIAKEKLAQVVSRETENLSSAEITRGAIETVAENIVDGVIAPLIYGIIGGPALAMTYKAINTLDSMVGYKNEQYLYYGRAAAKLDDLANYLPARITGVFMLLAIFIMRKPWKKALLAWLKFAHQHPSPNSGIPESVVAGALGIRLGGFNWYHGQQHFRAYMGEEERKLTPADIITTIKLMYITTLIFTGSAALTIYGLSVLGGRT